VITDDQGSRMYVCSDTDFCATRQEAGHHGRLGVPQFSSKKIAKSLQGFCSAEGVTE
jgi:alpha-D-ribose 1-methylphosphonate 5-phosphate C-P lyase